MTGRSARTWTAAALLGALGCSPPAGLEDVAGEWGVAFEHDSGYAGRYYFPEILGSGVGLVDVDGDGDLDLYAVQGGEVPTSIEAGLRRGPRPTNRLFRNAGDGSMTDATAESGAAADPGYGMGVAAADVDGDGDVDLHVTNVGADLLLANDGGGHFERAPGADAVADDRWTTASGFGDLDGDGHLDLVVVGYVAWSVATDPDCVSNHVLDYCHVNLYEAIGDRVYRGDGRGGFGDVTAEWGLADATGRGLGLALFDADDDGDVDLYVANDSVENHLWLNRGDGRLEDATYVSGAAYNDEGRPEAGMGLGLADVDADGGADLLVTNFAGESNTVYRNLGGGRFRDFTRQSGLSAPSRAPLGFGTAFADLDHDGIEDLVVTNGHVLRHVKLSRPSTDFPQPDQAFRGLPGGRFEPWDVGPEIERPLVGRGLAVGDLDGDGASEVVLLANGGPMRILKNRLPPAGSHWLRVQLVGAGTNTRAIGARVELELDDGSVQRRWVRSGTGFLSQDDLAPRFGVPAGRSARELRVRWPDGSTSSVPSPELDRSIEVRAGV